MLVYHLQAAGLLLLALAAIHPALPRRFRWKEELARLSLLNRQIFIVHTLFIVLLLVLTGLLSLCYAHALLTPGPLARPVLAGLAIFWGARLLAQWLVYSPKLWRGQPFNTLMHLVFTALWAYLAAVYAWSFYYVGSMSD